MKKVLDWAKCSEHMAEKLPRFKKELEAKLAEIFKDNLVERMPPSQSVEDVPYDINEIRTETKSDNFIYFIKMHEYPPRYVLRFHVPSPEESTRIYKKSEATLLRSISEVGNSFGLKVQPGYIDRIVGKRTRWVHNTNSALEKDLRDTTFYFTFKPDYEKFEVK